MTPRRLVKVNAIKKTFALRSPDKIQRSIDECNKGAIIFKRGKNIDLSALPAAVNGYAMLY